MLVQQALGSPSVVEAAASPHWREIYACTPLDGRLLEGYIDLLYRGPEGLVVVDYKTAATSDSDVLDRRVEGYRTQGASYALTVGASTGEPVVRVTFLFLTPGRRRRAPSGRPRRGRGRCPPARCRRTGDRFRLKVRVETPRRAKSATINLAGDSRGDSQPRCGAGAPCHYGMAAESPSGTTRAMSPSAMSGSFPSSATSSTAWRSRGDASMGVSSAIPGSRCRRPQARGSGGPRPARVTRGNPRRGCRPTRWR